MAITSDWSCNMMSIICNMSLAILIVIAFPYYNSILAAPAPSKESEASALLYSGWWSPSVTDNTTLPHCAWPGVLCDTSGSVHGIRLPYGYQIEGNLRSLTDLDLGENQLGGSIPPEIGNLRSLTDLDLGENQLDGSIPPEIGNLRSLTGSRFGRNQSGIPPEIGNLRSLTYLYLGGNMDLFLSEIGNLRSLTYLYLGA
ncbi:receptor-like protein 35 [Eucalyptus grandis]|uniref:receptor-like protein 35 n=1 Tax=Eucalyptus grandis TaxID=71139 RepID=UPI00192E9E98|nr:receptor-like protein 35 [Eucalyptus grandis]